RNNCPKGLSNRYKDKNSIALCMGTRSLPRRKAEGRSRENCSTATEQGFWDATTEKRRDPS
ncbi:hypothetical protein A2U01_0078363, partial [Trifolium medium]|nr:hypothetical protein [Trifolium medium]